MFCLEDKQIYVLSSQLSITIRMSMSIFHTILISMVFVSMVHGVHDRNIHNVHDHTVHDHTVQQNITNHRWDQRVMNAINVAMSIPVSSSLSHVNIISHVADCISHVVDRVSRELQSHPEQYGYLMKQLIHSPNHVLYHFLYFVVVFLTVSHVITRKQPWWFQVGFALSALVSSLVMSNLVLSYMYS